MLLGRSREEYRKERMADPHLSERGQIQAEHTACFLSVKDVDSIASRLIGKIDQLYCSPVLRALETCLPISKAMKMRPYVWMDCYEHGGMYERDFETKRTSNYGGLTEHDMKTQFPTFDFDDGAFTSKGWYTGGYESQKKCSARAASVSERLKVTALNLKADRTIALVAHHDFLDVLLRHILDIDINVRTSPVGTQFRHFNTAMSCVEIYPSKKPEKSLDLKDKVTTRMLFMNMVRHLPDSLVSWDKLGII